MEVIELKRLQVGQAEAEGTLILAGRLSVGQVIIWKDSAGGWKPSPCADLLSLIRFKRTPVE